MVDELFNFLLVLKYDFYLFYSDIPRVRNGRSWLVENPSGKVDDYCQLALAPTSCVLVAYKNTCKPTPFKRDALQGTFGSDPESTNKTKK